MLKAAGIFQRKAETETCAKHRLVLRVRYTDNLPRRHPKIVAAQLKMLAVNTDGRCAIVGSYDAEILDRGMRFRFTSVTKRDQFKARIANYLSISVTSRLTYSV